MALTLADVWNAETDGKAVIVGQGGAMRATAGLVGHGGCLVNARPVIAASYATEGGWETNPKCYVMSQALTSLNAKKYWTTERAAWMGHDIATATRSRRRRCFSASRVTRWRQCSSTRPSAPTRSRTWCSST